MENQNQIRKTSMQELIEIILKTRELLSKDDKFKDHEYTLNIDTVINLLKNSYDIEAAILSHAFDFGFLQSELKENAEVTSGSEYIKKFYRKNEDISSEV